MSSCDPKPRIIFGVECEMPYLLQIQLPFQAKARAAEWWKDHFSFKLESCLETTKYPKNISLDALWNHIKSTILETTEIIDLLVKEESIPHSNHHANERKSFSTKNVRPSVQGKFSGEKLCWYSWPQGFYQTLEESIKPQVLGPNIIRQLSALYQ